MCRLKMITGLNSGLHNNQNGHLYEIGVKIRQKNHIDAIWPSSGPHFATLCSREKADPSRERTA